MPTLKITQRTSLAIKFSLFGLLLASVTACGPGGNTSSKGGGSRNVNPDDEEFLPDAMLEKLSLNGSEQLFSFKQSGSNDLSLHTSGATTSLKSSLDYGDDKIANVLKIVDVDGKSKNYLKGTKFDQFHVVKDGKQLAYVVRISEKDFKRFKIPGGGWIILRNNKQPVVLRTSPYKFIRDPSDYIGQTEHNGGLVFSCGAYVDLDGKKLSYGKNIDEVTQAQFVSGDYVALKRKINGKEVTTLVNVKPGSNFRRAYDNYFTPDFVQITNDGKGLMSDINTSTNWFSKDTKISRLEDEMSAAYINKSKRAPVFKDNDLKECLWFSASARIQGQEAALLTCYVSAGSPNAGYQLTLVTPKATTPSTWKLKFLFKMKDQSALNGIKKAHPFV